MWVENLDDEQPKKCLNETLYKKFLDSVKIIQEAFEKFRYFLD